MVAHGYSQVHVVFAAAMCRSLQQGPFWCQPVPCGADGDNDDCPSDLFPHIRGRRRKQGAAPMMRRSLVKAGQEERSSSPPMISFGRPLRLIPFGFVLSLVFLCCPSSARWSFSTSVCCRRALAACHSDLSCTVVTFTIMARLVCVIAQSIRAIRTCVLPLFPILQRSIPVRLRPAWKTWGCRRRDFIFCPLWLSLLCKGLHLQHFQERGEIG
jgi:hypothetical protein